MIIRWRPLRYEKGREVDLRSCRAAVHEDFGAGFYQCQRKPTMTVGGMRLCTQHGKMMKKQIRERR